MRENMNTAIRGRKDLKGLNVPFLGEIPLYSREGGRLLGRFRKSRDGHETVVAEDNRDYINEAFRVLRTNVEMMSEKGGKSDVIAVTSFNPGQRQVIHYHEPRRQPRHKEEKSARHRR